MLLYHCDQLLRKQCSELGVQIYVVRQILLLGHLRAVDFGYHLAQSFPVRSLALRDENGFMNTRGQDEEVLAELLAEAVKERDGEQRGCTVVADGVRKHMHRHTFVVLSMQQQIENLVDLLLGIAFEIATRAIAYTIPKNIFDDRLHRAYSRLHKLACVLRRQLHQLGKARLPNRTMLPGNTYGPHALSAVKDEKMKRNRQVSEIDMRKCVEELFVARFVHQAEEYMLLDILKGKGYVLLTLLVMLLVKLQNLLNDVLHLLALAKFLEEGIEVDGRHHDRIVLSNDETVELYIVVLYNGMERDFKVSTHSLHNGFAHGFAKCAIVFTIVHCLTHEPLGSSFLFSM